MRAVGGQRPDSYLFALLSPSHSFIYCIPCYFFHLRHARWDTLVRKKLFDRIMFKLSLVFYKLLMTPLLAVSLQVILAPLLA